MSVLQGAAESGGVPVSRLHERQSFDPADFPVPTGREEEWRFTPLRPPLRAAGRYGAARALGPSAQAGPGPVVTCPAALPSGSGQSRG
jgi:hypothetical protein